MMASSSDDIFFRLLFDALPVWALVVDSGGRVRKINSAATSLLQTTEEAVFMKKGGDVFHCASRNEGPDGCGSGEVCRDCPVRSNAMKAIAGQKVVREKGPFTVEIGGKTKQLSLLVTAAPFEFQNEKLAIVIIEDVSTITELQGLIPICACCKKVRRDDGYWQHVEQYISTRSEADFTHSICPECRDKLYPQFKNGREKKAK